MNPKTMRCSKTFLCQLRFTMSQRFKFREKKTLRTLNFVPWWRLKCLRECTVHIGQQQFTIVMPPKLPLLPFQVSGLDAFGP